MKRGFEIRNYQQALDFLESKPQKKVDNSCFLFESNGTIFVRLEDLVIVEYRNDGIVIVKNHSRYNARMKRYISSLSPAKIVQKEYQWYVGDEIFFSTMVFENSVWRKE